MCNRQYHTVNQIGVGDNVEYQKSLWQVIINYISGETDKTGYTPLFNRTILINETGKRVNCHNYKQLRRLD